MIENVWLYQGDCVEVLRSWPEASVDAVVCDPPYGLEFMGKEWDKLTRNLLRPEGKDAERVEEYGNSYAGRRSRLPDLSKTGGAEAQAWHEAWARECLRVLKPGGHLIAFGGSRTWHRMACAVEDAGFEVRDCLMWLYGSGFPKSKNVALSIDKGEGYPDRGRAIPTASLHLPGGKYAEEKLTSNPVEPYVAKSEAAKAWEGWGTALKPAHEPIILARKPLDGTVAENVQRWGTGALNIDGCRIGTAALTYTPKGIKPGQNNAVGVAWDGGDQNEKTVVGRWPANIMLDEEAGAMLGEASRFFYCPKPSRREREHGLDGFPVRSAGEVTDREDGSAGLNSPRAGAGRTSGARNTHPTVKPVELMRYLCRLVTPPGGVVLDPFVGSGTTGMAARLEGFRFIGIDREAEYLQIAQARIAAADTLE